MSRKADVWLTLGCIVALGVSAAGAVRRGTPLRTDIDAWFRVRQTRKALKRDPGTAWSTIISWRSGRPQP